MFSPAKTITAAALVFAVTGAFLVAQPLGLPGTSVPGAEIDVEPAEPIEVSGRWMGYDCEVGPHYCTQEWSMSDPRLDGTVKWFSTEWKDPDFNPVTFGYTSYAIENDGGSWRGLTDAWVRLPGTGDSGYALSQDLVLEGEGGYEGLTLIMRLDDFADDSGLDMRGYIIDDAFPPPPDFGSTE